MKYGECKKDALRQKGVFLQPDKYEDYGQDAPDHRSGPPALDQEKPYVAQKKKAGQGQEHKKVMRQQTEKHKTGQQKHSRAPDAGAAEIRHDRHCQTESKEPYRRCIHRYLRTSITASDGVATLNTVTAPLVSSFAIAPDRMAFPRGLAWGSSK